MLYPDISGIMPAYGWEAPYALTGEGLPYIGPHRFFPRHLQQLIRHRAKFLTTGIGP